MEPVVEPCLSVVMPCFNEAATVESMVARVLASPYTAEVIVVDDGSTDGSAELLAGLTDPRLRVLTQDRNRGKGAAVRLGFSHATSPFVIVQDADGEYDPDEFPHVLAPLLADKADVVYGSRFHTARPHRVLYFWHSVGNRILTTTSNVFTNLNLTDMETCYKVFRREVIQSFVIEEDRFGFEPEITAKVARGGWRIYEVGISYSGRTYAEGKKINWKDGVRAIYCIVRYSALGGRLLKPPTGSHADVVDFDEADEELTTTLDSLDGATNYADWIYSMMEPHLGQKVLEVGAGHGTLTDRLMQGRCVTATDVSPRCVAMLEEKYRDDPEVDVKFCDIEQDVEPGPFDSVVLVNVLEHLDDDEKALRRLREALRPGGSLLLFVPAFERLYSDFDRRIGHRRRYHRRALADVVTSAGLDPVDIHYVNSLGVAAWWLVAKKLRRTPADGPLVATFDRAVVPTLRRMEERYTPPFGQSLLCVARRPA